MRKSTRDEIGTARDRREIRADREENNDKWTHLLLIAVDKCGFRLELNNNGMMSIVDPDHKKVIAHAPIHIPSKRKLGSIAQDCGIPMEFVLN